ncbi:MAG: MlaA family lipoprotein [Betaproteobacteria bacterium]
MMSTAFLRTLPRIAAALMLAAVAGCATTGSADRHSAGPKDPYEPFNRKMFSFNDTLDTYALKPVATAYKDVVPSPIRTGVHNFFGNFSDAWSAVNQLLQGKPGDAATMTMRVLTNTTIGIAGLFDPATDLGLERKSEDLGQTLGRWGLEPGPYLVLPLFGSSDIRDGIALPADTYVSPTLLVSSTWQKVGVDAIGVIDARAGLLGASQMLDELAFDRYTFMRDAYVSRRRSLVYDGNPPDLPDADDADDSKTAPAPAGAASGAQSGLKPVLPSASPASGGQSSIDGSIRVAAAAPSVVPSQPASTPAPGSVTPAPLPASAPTLPVPLPGPAPVPAPPASGAH